MSDHMTEWLNAYLDGELKNGRLHQVQAHLAECRECQAELQSLMSLSSLLHEAPLPEFISSERIAAQVNLRLPHEQPRASKRKAQEVGWWVIPVSLVVIWVFINASGIVSDVLSTANGFGLLNNSPAWLVPGTSNSAIWSGTLSQLGLLKGEGLEWAEITEAFTRNTLPQFVWQMSIALVYLGWIVIWWTRQMHQRNGRPLEG